MRGDDMPGSSESKLRKPFRWSLRMHLEITCSEELPILRLVAL